ncbi:MAG: tetratricopeptide repeat protein [Porticoccaceae bacterium]|nr:tetratricopeptide repeat protein [Porticoccaceae bacterium]
MRMQIRRSGLIAVSLITALLLSLTACGTQHMAKLTAGTPGDLSKVASDTEVTDAAPDYPVRAFPTQTFYALLVAEFAGARGDVQLAVDSYVEHAKITRDPNVVERAVRTASFSRDKAALEQLSRLWVEVDPDNSEAHKLAFFFVARDGEIDSAFNHARLLLEQGDGEPLISLPGFTETLDPSNRGLLLSRYDQLLQAHPLDRNILLGKIRLQGQQNNIEQALETSKTLLKLEPDNEDARLAIAQLLYNHGEDKKAIITLNQGIKRNPESKKLQLQRIRFIAEVDLDSARQKMIHLVANHEDDFDLLFSLGLLNRQLGLHDEARQAFEKMITHNRRLADAHYQLAVMADQDHRSDEAQAHYAQVNEGNNLLPAIARMTQLMSDDGQTTKARLYLHQLRLERPHLVVALYRLESELLMGQKRYDSAYSLLTEGLAEHPESSDLLYTRSLVSEKLNDIVSVEQDLRAILDQDTNNVSALNALGYSLANHTDRYQEALALIRQALEISPDDAAIVDSLGWVLYRLGKHEEAVAHLRTAMARVPDPEVAAHLGEVLWVSGKKDEALNIWRKALKSAPDSKYLLDTLDRFQVSL